MDDGSSGSGLNGVGIGLLKDNAVCYSNSLSNFGGSSSAIISLPELSNGGSYNLTVFAEDNSGNHSFRGLSFSIDTSVPDAPREFRHIFDGRNVYLEWDPVIFSNLAGYSVYNNSVKIAFTTNCCYTAIPQNGNIISYAVSAIGQNGNESGLSAPEWVNTSAAFSWSQPQTNVFFTGKMFVEADYTNVSPNTLNNISLDYTLSNSFVPTNFLFISNIPQIQALYTNSIGLDSSEDGCYVLRIKASNDTVPLEDSLAFGVDNTPPVTYLVINSNIIMALSNNQTVFLPSGSVSGFKAVDPVVNQNAAGIDSTYYLLQGQPIRKYAGNSIPLADGVYTLTFMSSDKSFYLNTNSFLGNFEMPRAVELHVGNFTLTQGENWTNNILPDIQINGVSDYCTYKVPLFISYQVNQAVMTNAILDGVQFDPLAPILTPGRHRLRVEAVSITGNILVKDIIFWLEP